MSDLSSGTAPRFHVVHPSGLKPARRVIFAMSLRAAVLLLAFTLLASIAASATLRLIHFNDPHGRWAPETATFTPCVTPATCFGGFPKLITAAAALRASAPGDALVLHAGDQVSRTVT